TSNPGSGDLQDQRLATTDRPLFEYVAARANTWDETYPATVGLVVGATWPGPLREVRRGAPTMPIPPPGLGSQGGDLAASLEAGLTPDGSGVICSVSRGIMYAASGENFADAARAAAIALRNAINEVRHA